ncbi:MAG TPA: NAD(P)H-hydrate epimerase, partial [Casimicrobiaceae bacterium]|nr:NAD(P)H-hydrate epimerase [Casimicrobiaceae bacterium]
MASASLVPVARVAEVREIERRASSAPLMERAGAAAAQVAREVASGAGKVLVLAGPGNNGGDAFVVARLLREAFFEVTVVFAGAVERLPADAAAAWAALRDAGGSTVSTLPQDWHGGLIVDGLFGIGLRRAVDAPYAQWIAWAN